ncbi:SCO family protein [Oleiharenicola lentus]|uniref:SCO family protein n=1 Tax=Oleiharenicola lentus TaxID=2508720 RepID=A0A4Q1C8F9_9BACT|nr:SCO family protein [Oleiharenicola lentus]RXK55178.1 SCO family protein [Oleiharenicola lentus]
MKTTIPLITLLFAASIAASDKPAACCPADTKPKAGSCCTVEKADKAACCAEKPSAPAACCAEKAQPAACCAQADAPKPAACCEEIKGSETTAFSSESLYQLEAGFTDDRGRSFTLGSLRGRPVVLTMFFASCSYACPLLLTDMQAIHAKLPADIRDRAAFVLVSFDVARDTPAALAQYRADRHLDAQWTLLHGDDDAVRELAALLGVKFKQEADGQFAHSNLITILNGGGEVVHQRTGLRGGLDETAQAIVAASR